MKTTLPISEGTTVVSAMDSGEPRASEGSAARPEASMVFVLAFPPIGSGVMPGFCIPIAAGITSDARSSDAVKLLSELSFALRRRLDSVERLLGVLLVPRSSIMDTSSDHRSLLGWPVTVHVPVLPMAEDVLGLPSDAVLGPEFAAVAAIDRGVNSGATGFNRDP